MRHCNRIKASLEKISELLLRRPQLLPSVVIILAVNLYYYFAPPVNVPDMISCAGVVRHINMKLDGTTEVEIRTDQYGRILYRGTSDEGIRTGDEFLIEGKINGFDKKGNPGEFDYGTYLRRRGISGIVYPERMECTGNSPFASRLYDIQIFFNNVRRFAVSCFEEDDRALAAALFTGDTSLISDDMSRMFRLSDCSHLLAVSGTHFAGFLMILSEVLRKLHVKRKISGPLYVLFILVTGTLTGWSESVTRAAVMSVCTFMSRDYVSGMSLAVIMLAVKDPYSLLSSGFLMSFSASLSIRVSGPQIESILIRLGLHDKVSNILTPVIAATVGMMPFWDRTCYYFSPLHLLTQIAASFLASAACVFFIPTVITGLPFACSLIFKVLCLLMRLTSSTALDSVSSADLTPGFTYSLFALIFVLLMPEGIIRRLLIKPSAAFLMISSGLMLGSLINGYGIRIVFIDVGQGDSCLIMSEGRSILIDGGVEDQGKYAVSQVLDYYGINSVDLAVATHMDEDHIGGLEYLKSEGRIDSMVTCYDINAGDVIAVTGELNLYCLWPYEVTDGGNEDSIVLRLEYEGLSVLFTGDIGFESEEELIDLQACLDSDILKVGHHGSAYSTSMEFIESVSPDISVISVAQNNRYGHPAPSTLERLESYGCEIRRTDLEGAVIYEY